MKDRIKMKGQLKLYMQWPAFMGVFLLILNAWIFKVDKNAGFVMCVFLLIYAIGVGALYLYNKSLVLAD